MSDKVKLKEVVVDKTMKVAVKTTKGMKEGSKSFIKSQVSAITNYTEDFYEELDDVGTGTAKEIGADALYGARTAYRGGRSLMNVKRKHDVRKDFRNEYAEAKLEGEQEEQSEQIESRDEECTIYEESDAEFNDQDDSKKSESNDDKRKELKKEAKKEWKKKSKGEKNEIYKARNKKIKPGIDVKASAKKTFRNQTRKAVNKLASKDDMGAKTIGRSAKGIWTIVRYRRTAANIVKKLVMIAKHMFTGAISFMISIPAMITAVMASLPLMIICLFIILIISIFGFSEYTGRITVFVDEEVYLEYRYDTNVAPDEILSITSVLGWGEVEQEQYEALFALIMDGKDEETWVIGYDTMLDNIFNKYNPAKFAWRDDIKVKRETFIGTYKTENLTYQDYLDLYPKYKELSAGNKQSYGSVENINELKAQAKEALGKNGILYTNRYIETETDFFEERPLKIEDIEHGASSYKVGYRNFMDGAFHGGTDISANVGTKVYAVSDAKVIHTYDGITAGGEICTSSKAEAAICGTNLAGNQVVLQMKIKNKKTDAEAFLYLAYFHLLNGSVRVRTGDMVKAGDYLGDVGDTGMSFGGHLHIQSWIDDKDGYFLPYSKEKDALDTWQKMIDATMLCDIEFRNYIYGR